MATATAPKQERPQQQLIAEGINLIGMLSCDLVRKLERLDSKTKTKLFIDFPLTGSPEENFNALAQWAETLKRQNLI
jgi:hypothetical protein